MRLTRGADEDQLELRVAQNLVVSVIDLDILGCFRPEARCEFASRSGGVAFENSMQLEVLWERKDEGYVESEAAETNTEDT